MPGLLELESPMGINPVWVLKMEFSLNTMEHVLWAGTLDAVEECSTDMVPPLRAGVSR